MDVFMDNAKVMAKGQITIPKDVRDVLGVSSGDRVTFIVEGPTVRMVNSAVYAMQMLQQDMAGEAAEEDGVYYFRTPDDALCSWDGETVETLLPSGEFTGQYLYMEHGVLFYSDRKGLGLFAYEPATGLSEQLIEYDRSLAVWYPTFWWTDADGYYLLTKVLSKDGYRISYYDGEGQFPESYILSVRGAAASPQAGG